MFELTNIDMLLVTKLFVPVFSKEKRAKCSLYLRIPKSSYTVIVFFSGRQQINPTESYKAEKKMTPGSNENQLLENHFFGEK